MSREPRPTARPDIRIHDGVVSASPDRQGKRSRLTLLPR